MKQFMVISILATLSCITFAQGNDANAPGKKRQEQSVKQFTTGREKDSGQSAKPHAPGQQDKSQIILKDPEVPGGKESYSKNKQ